MYLIHHNLFSSGNDNATGKLAIYDSLADEVIGGRLIVLF